MGRRGLVAVHRDQRGYQGNRRPLTERSHRADLDRRTIYNEKGQIKVTTRLIQLKKFANKANLINSTQKSQKCTYDVFCFFLQRNFRKS